MLIRVTYILCFVLASVCDLWGLGDGEDESSRQASRDGAICVTWWALRCRVGGYWRRDKNRAFPTGSGKDRGRLFVDVKDERRLHAVISGRRLPALSRAGNHARRRPCPCPPAPAPDQPNRIRCQGRPRNMHLKVCLSGAGNASAASCGKGPCSRPHSRSTRGHVQVAVARYTYLCADLVAALAGLDVHDFSHFGGCVMRSSRSDE